MFKYILILLLVVASCTSVQPRVYEVTKPITIHIEPINAIRERGLKELNCLVNGLAYVEQRVIYVPYGVGGLPDFYILGHEIWHMEELGGRNFHEE